MWFFFRLPSTSYHQKVLSDKILQEFRFPVFVYMVHFVDALNKMFVMVFQIDIFSHVVYLYTSEEKGSVDDI